MTDDFDAPMTPEEELAEKIIIALAMAKDRKTSRRDLINHLSATLELGLRVLAPKDFKTRDNTE